jgi:Asp-tRNA(Asn)/Glu-tRNA(Gln) amidotransferase A subunit family amidase
MARTVKDVRLLFEVLAGYDSADPFSAPVPLRKNVSLEGCVGVMEQFLDEPVEDVMRLAVRKAAGLLQSSGLKLDEFRPAGIEEARNIWWFFFGELTAPFTRQMFEGRESDAHATGVELLKLTHADHVIQGQTVVEHLGTRDRMRAMLFHQMKDFPVLLMPACAVPAFEHGQREWTVKGQTLGMLDITALATPWNLLGMPGLVVPMDITPEGLPIGIQLVARPYEEELLLHVGELLEAARGPFPGPPGY